MSILVTGGAGYIGSHTVVELVELDYDVVVVDNLSNSDPIVLDRIKEITGQEITFYEIDLLDKENLRRVFEENHIDSVIHFAGYKAVGESVDKPLKYYHNNLTSTLVLLELMTEYEVKNFIFSSSATVYGDENEAPFTEDMPVGAATNPYGQTKLMIENILRDQQIAQPDWSVTLLRYFNPVGAHESGLIGEDPSGIPNNLLPYVTQVAVGRLDKLSIFGDDYSTPDGTGVRDYIHVVDLAKGHLQALQKSDEPGVHIYNLGTGNGVSVLDLVHTFVKVNDVEVPYELVERRPGDVAVSYADPSKAEKELNWKAENNLEDMMRDSWNWQKNNPNGYDTL